MSSGCVWVQGSAKRGRRAYLVGSSLAALTAAEDGEALWHTKMGAGVVVRASAVSLSASGGAEEGDEAEDGVWEVWDLRRDVNERGDVMGLRRRRADQRGRENGKRETERWGRGRTGRVEEGGAQWGRGEKKERERGEGENESKR